MAIQALSNAASGMKVADRMMSAAASNVANVNTPDYDSVTPVVAERAGGGAAVVGVTREPGVDIASQMVQMLVAGASMKANVASARSAAQAYDDVLDLKR